MNDERTERWLELCALAEKEQDPGKLIALVSEINRLLEENRLRRKQNYASMAPTAFSC